MHIINKYGSIFIDKYRQNKDKLVQLSLGIRHDKQREVIPYISDYRFKLYVMIPFKKHIKITSS